MSNDGADAGRATPARLAALEREVSELREQARYYRDIYENAPDMYVSVDADSARIKQCNRTLCQRLGYSRQELVGRPIFKVYDPSCMPRVKAAFETFVKTGEVHNARLVLRTKQGKTIPVLLDVSAVRDEQGKILHSRSSWRDITDLVAAEEELRKALDDLERSNRDLRQFAYVASHDLQEPLRMVASFTELLRRKYRGKLDAEADRYIDYAVEGATRMNRLIVDLLQYARLGNETMELEPVEVEPLVQGILDDLGPRLEACGGVVEVGPLPTLMADRSQLRQVLQNLLSNAVKFHGAAPPRVHLTAEQVEGRWRFCVQDNGIGIAPEHTERIFHVFQRLHVRKRYAGSGIGLAIVEKLVERHGGRVWVESEPGKGSRFYFTMLAL